MPRTKGSGWGAGPLLYQICPECGKKKCIFDPLPPPDSYYKPFKCTSCKKHFDSDTLIRSKYPPYKKPNESNIGK